MDDIGNGMSTLWTEYSTGPPYFMEGKYAVYVMLS
jgi:hypothetical protein